MELDDGEFIYEGVEKGEAQRKSRLAAVQRMQRIGLCGGVLPNPQEWWEVVNNHFKHGLSVAGDLTDDDQKELLAEVLARKFEARKARADEELEKRSAILDGLTEKGSTETKSKSNKPESSARSGKSGKAGKSKKQKK